MSIDERTDELVADVNDPSSVLKEEQEAVIAAGETIKEIYRRSRQRVETPLESDNL